MVNTSVSDLQLLREEVLTIEMIEFWLKDEHVPIGS